MLIKFYHCRQLDLLFSANIEAVPRVGELVVRGERPIDYRVIEVLHDVGNERTVKVYLEPSERKYRK